MYIFFFFLNLCDLQQPPDTSLLSSRLILLILSSALLPTTNLIMCFSYLIVYFIPVTPKGEVHTSMAVLAFSAWRELASQRPSHSFQPQFWLSSTLGTSLDFRVLYTPFHQLGTLVHLHKLFPFLIVIPRQSYYKHPRWCLFWGHCHSTAGDFS